MNGPNLDFFNFPSGKASKFNNIKFVNIKIENKHYFKIDGHLNKNGHEFIAEQLEGILN